MKASLLSCPSCPSLSFVQTSLPSLQHVKRSQRQSKSSTRHRDIPMLAAFFALYCQLPDVHATTVALFTDMV